MAPSHSHVSRAAPVQRESSCCSGCCCCCFTCPEQESIAFVEQCGKFSHIAHPGFNCVNCLFGARVAGHLSLRVQQLDVKCETKTLDNVFVQFVISVQYQVKREALFDAFYKLTDSRQQISSYVFDEVRAAVPKLNLDDVFTEKEEIAKHMNEINAARRMRVAAMEKAEAQKLAVVKAAEAEAEAKFLQGQGIARQRQAIINGLKESVSDFQTGVDVSAKDVLELMLITQYFDTLRDVGAHGKSNTVFLNHAPGTLSDIQGQIRSSILEANAVAR